MHVWERLGTPQRRIIIAVVIAVLAASLLFYMTMVRESGPIPRSARRGLAFELYYPYKLPKGYYVVPSSFMRAENDVLTFSIAAPHGRNVAVSEAALPADPPEHKKISKLMQIPGELIYDTPIGSAKINDWNKQYVSDITTPTTWIILNVTGFTFEEAKAVTNSFAQL